MVLIGHVKGPRGGPKPYPPTPPPHLSPTLCQGYRRMGVGRGGAAVGHLLPPGPRPHSLTALTLHICQLPPDISDRSPFYREHAPVGALDTERPARLWNNGAWEGGGKLGREKGMCDLKYPLSWEKTQRTVHLVPTHFFPERLHPLVYV